MLTKKITSVFGLHTLSTCWEMKKKKKTANKKAEKGALLRAE
jgi:hypothetical protein